MTWKKMGMSAVVVLGVSLGSAAAQAMDVENLATQTENELDAKDAFDPAEVEDKVFVSAEGHRVKLWRDGKDQWRADVTEDFTGIEYAGLPVGFGKDWSVEQLMRQDVSKHRLHVLLRGDSPDGLQEEGLVYVGKVGLLGGTGAWTKEEILKKKGTMKGSHKVNSFHVSCSSDKPKSFEKPGENFTGMVLYLHNGKTDWKINGYHCKIGYIVLKKSSKISNVKTSHQSQVHGKLYKYMFGEELDESKTVVGGFAYYNGEWRGKSNLNYGNSYHPNTGKYYDDDECCENYEYKEFKSVKNNKDNKGIRKAGVRESYWITKAIKNWIKEGTQTTKVTDDMWISRGMSDDDILESQKSLNKKEADSCRIL